MYTIVDRTSGIPVARLTLPPGWQIDEHYEQDPNNPYNMFFYYKRNLFGPTGEVVSYFFPFTVYHMFNEQPDAIWSGHFLSRIGSLGKFELGPIVESPLRQQLLPHNAPAAINFYERDFVGLLLNGNEVKGKTFAMMAEGPFSSVVAAYAVMSPRDRWQETLSTFIRIVQTTEENPQYLQYLGQVMTRKAQMAQQMMANQKAVFEQRMSSARQASELRSEANRDFMSNLLQSNTGSSDSSYGTNDAYNDYLKGTTSFDDPYTGYQITQQGYHERWFTDNLGNYVGTNNPSFDPSSLSGHWSPIQPLGN